MLFQNNWQNITLDKFYHPVLQYFLRCFMDYVYIISVAAYFFMSYIILTQSTNQMGTFKYTIFIQTTFNFIMDSLFFIFCPIFHWPLPLISFYSHFPLSQSHPFFQANLIILSAIGFIIVFFVSLFLRIISSFQFNMFAILNQFWWIFVIFFVIVFLFVGTTFTIPLIYLERDSLLYQAKLMEEIPSISQLFLLLPNTFGLHPTFNMNLIYLYFCIAVFWIIAAAILLIILNVIYLIRLKTLAKQSSKEIFSLCKMLYKTLIAQLFTFLIFCGIPAMLIVVAFTLQLENGSILANLALPMCSFHI